MSVASYPSSVLTCRLVSIGVSVTGLGEMCMRESMAKLCAAGLESQLSQGADQVNVGHRDAGIYFACTHSCTLFLTQR